MAFVGKEGGRCNFPIECFLCENTINGIFRHQLSLQYFHPFIGFFQLLLFLYVGIVKDFEGLDIFGEGCFLSNYIFQLIILFLKGMDPLVVFLYEVLGLFFKSFHQGSHLFVLGDKFGLQKFFQIRFSHLELIFLFFHLVFQFEDFQFVIVDNLRLFSFIVLEFLMKKTDLILVGFINLHHRVYPHLQLELCPLICCFYLVLLFVGFLQPCLVTFSLSIEFYKFLLHLNIISVFLVCQHLLVLSCKLISQSYFLRIKFFIHLLKFCSMLFSHRFNLKFILIEERVELSF